jgi:hypothetical protein
MLAYGSPAALRAAPPRGRLLSQITNKDAQQENDLSAIANNKSRATQQKAERKPEKNRIKSHPAQREKGKVRRKKRMLQTKQFSRTHVDRRRSTA